MTFLDLRRFLLLLKRKSFQNIVIIKSDWRWKRLNNPSGFFCVEPVKTNEARRHCLCSFVSERAFVLWPADPQITMISQQFNMWGQSDSHLLLSFISHRYYCCFSAVKLKCWSEKMTAFLTAADSKGEGTSTLAVLNDQHVTTSCQTLKHVSVFLLTGFLLLILKSFVSKPSPPTRGCTFGSSGKDEVGNVFLSPQKRRNWYRWCV